MDANLDPENPSPTPWLEPLELDVEPLDILPLWPKTCPLAVLWSGGSNETTGEFSVQAGARWVYFANPSKRVTFGPQAGRGEILGFFAAYGGGDVRPTPPDAPPFARGWMGWMSYELGDVLEPAARGAGTLTGPASAPLMEWFRVEGVLAYDTHKRKWWRTHGDKWHLPDPVSGQNFAFSAGVGEADDAAAYRAAVERTIEYIRAGDVYQANITREAVWPFEGSARGLFGSLMREASPWYGAYFEADDPWVRRAVASASPELFLSFDAASREVRTRPMKGTQRPGGEAVLRESAKDAAELTMIVDLMRNDLGRICAPGTVRVEDHRAMERHGAMGSASAIVQTTSVVRGELAPDRTLADIVAATFPAGSITGAPKIRAMQIIRELEGRKRGVYCGAIGSIDDNGSMQLSVAIRTAALAGTAIEGTADGVKGILSYGVGAGIVAESDPASEWWETGLKAGGIARVLAAAAPTPAIGGGE